MRQSSGLFRRLIFSVTSMLPHQRKGSWQTIPGVVYLVSYPRSGNTWMRYLLANLLEPGIDWNLNNINRIIPPVYKDPPDDMVESNPRIVKSHEPFCSDYPRVIYLYRDGRDVAVSYHDFSQKLEGYQEGLAAFLLDMLQGRLPYGSWQAHVGSWLFRGSSVVVQGISYEELFEDTIAVLERVAEFLDYRWTEKEFKNAIAKSTLKKHRQDLRRYRKETHWSKGFQGGVKGAPGKWREVFDEELNDLYWKYAGQVAERLGYSKTGGRADAL